MLHFRVERPTFSQLRLYSNVTAALLTLKTVGIFALVRRMNTRGLQTKVWSDSCSHARVRKSDTSRLRPIVSTTGNFKSKNKYFQYACVPTLSKNKTKQKKNKKKEEKKEEEEEEEEEEYLFLLMELKTNK